MLEKVAGIAVIGVVLVGAAHELTRSGPQPSGSAKPLSPAEQGRFLPQQDGPVGTYPLGPITFHIPKGFRPGYYQAGTPDGAGAIMLFALLPDLSPETPENKAEFDQPGWGNRIEISIQYNQGPFSGEALRKIYEKTALNGSPTWEEGIYTVRRLGASPTMEGRTIPGIRDLYVSRDGSFPDFFVCDRSQDNSEQYTPSCNVILPIRLDSLTPDKTGKNPMSIEYVFARKHAELAKDFITKASSLIDSFQNVN